MEKLHRAAEAFFGRIDSIARGLAQMASLGQDKVHIESSSRSDSEVLMGDWIRVGENIERGIGKARGYGKSA